MAKKKAACQMKAREYVALIEAHTLGRPHERDRGVAAVNGLTTMLKVAKEELFA